MSKNGNAKKDTQLGMTGGKANGKLKKNIMFWLAGLADMLTCYRCGKKIETVKEFSSEHKTPWLGFDDPQATFFALTNIAFSHLKCNCASIRPALKKYFTKAAYRAARASATAKWKQNLGPETRKAKRHEQYKKHGW